MPSSFTWPVVPPNSVPVAGPSPVEGVSGVPRKVEEIKLGLPPEYSRERGEVLPSILHGMGWEDHRIAVGDRALIIDSGEPFGTVRYVAKIDDPSLTVRHLYPSTFPSTLSVLLVGTTITIQLGTNSGGVINTTPAAIKALFEADTAVNALVLVQVLGSANLPVAFTREPLPLEYDGIFGARRDVLLRYARGEDLVIIGENLGVRRPARFRLLDDQFRQYISALSYGRKLTLNAIERLLTILFGPSEAAGWATYEIQRRTVTIELPTSLLRRRPASATYMRLSSTVSTNAHTGDYFRATTSQRFQPPVKPTSMLPLSPIFNNSVYVSPSANGYESLRTIFDLVRAAGVRIVFKNPAE